MPNIQLDLPASEYISDAQSQTIGLAGWIGFAGRFEFEI